MKDINESSSSIGKSVKESENPQKRAKPSAEISSYSRALIIINGWVCSSSCVVDGGG